MKNIILIISFLFCTVSIVYAQKQPGLYSVFCHPVGGTPDPVLFVDLYKAICNIPDAQLRLCPDESFYVIKR